MIRDRRDRRVDLEAAVMRLGDITDCVVLQRAISTGAVSDQRYRAWTVVYAVPGTGAQHEVIKQRVANRLAPEAAEAAEVAVVPVRRIPRRHDGSPDLAALAALPTLTGETVRSYSERVAERGVKVELRPVAAGAPMLRLADRDAAPAAGVTATRPGGAGDREEQRLAPTGETARPSLAQGPPLGRLPSDPATVTQAIVESAQRFPQLGVRAVSRDGDPFIPYPDLLVRGKRVLGGLRERGLAPGSYAMLLVPTLTEYFAASWGCLLGGVIGVTVSSPASFEGESPVLDKLVHAWRALGRPLIVTDADTAVVVDALATLYGEARVDAVSVAELERGEPSEDVYRARPEDVAIFALSSGSTGQSKVIQVTHRAIVENAISSRDVRLVLPGEVSLNWLPFDHVAPQVMYLLRDVVLGCSGVHAPTGYIVEQPLRWLEVLDKYRVNHTWSANFGYRLVTDALRAEPDRRFDLAHVRTLLNAGEQCTPPVIRDFLARTAEFGLGIDNIVHMWGMAETATGATCKFFAQPRSVRRILKSSLSGRLREADPGVDDAECIELMSMGPPAPGARVRVTDDDNRVQPEGVIGRFQVRATRVTPGYLNNPEANREAFTPDGWFDTGDLAFIMDGEVVITGRSKELIVINGEKYYCHEIEDLCGGLDGVRSGLVAACGVPDAERGSEVLAVFLVPERPCEEPSLELIERVRAAVAARLRLTARHVLPITEAEFPRTTSGKIQRAALVRRMTAGEFDDLVARVENARARATAVPDCVFTPGWQAAQPRLGAAQPAGGPTLLFADELGLAERMLGTGETIAVRPGDGYRCEPGGYVIDPDRGEDWAALRADLERRGLLPGTVMYLWSYLATPDPAGERDAVYRATARCGRYLAACCSTFLRADDPRPPHLVTVSRQLYRVTGDEDVCYPAAQAAAITATLARELREAHVRHVDLPGLSVHEDAYTLLRARRDLGAGGANGAGGTEAVWRRGRPYVRAVTPVAEVGHGRDALVRGGCYLVSGGCGGVGGRLLGELADRYGARFLVLGRRDPAVDAELAAAWSALAAPGREVRYRVADVVDPAAVRAAADEAERLWGRLDGVIHLADAYRLRLLEQEDPADWNPARLAKVAGTLNLLDVVRARPGARLVVFSSLLGPVAFTSCAAYGAGNAFAEALVDNLVHRYGVPATSLAWGLWQGLGINRDNPYEAAVTRRGVLRLSPEQGSLLCRAVLRHEPGVYHIGLDPTAPEMRGLVATDDGLCLERAVLVGGAGLDPDALPELTDPFGVPAPIGLEEAAPQDAQAGLSEEESEILAGVQAVLARFVAQPVGPSSRLYELGINSIQMLQLHAHLEGVLDLDIPKAALFEHPTVGELVSYLAAEVSAAEV